MTKYLGKMDFAVAGSPTVHRLNQLAPIDWNQKHRLKTPVVI